MRMRIVLIAESYLDTTSYKSASVQKFQCGQVAVWGLVRRQVEVGQFAVSQGKLIFLRALTAQVLFLWPGKLAVFEDEVEWSARVFVPALC